ncbi:MAG TPA: protein-disulfide reductase DsbD N-terminal domain-containing protein, partial [Bryobacteraceae bacterium]
MSRRFAAVLVLAAASAFAQKLDPVQWTLAAGDGKIAPGGQIVLTLKATLEPGWHMYSPSTPPGGPIATTITVADSPAVDQFSVHEPKPETQRDPNFDNLEVRWFEKEVSFALPVQIKKDAGPGEVQIAAQVRYQACDAKQCLPPRKKTATAAVTIDPAAPSQVGAIPAGYLAVAKRAETTRGVNPGAQPPANQPQAAQNAD